ncbi:NERD domain-containing protein [Microcystis elabens FACHB-917]|nr:NERD domain-containing protein [Microcystis elabens FACHB-917]
MAEMIPDSIPKDASRGEKGLFAAFRDVLPDDFIVWHEPNATTSRPDFVILSATHGLLVVETKGWSKGMIKQADSKSVLIEWPTTDGSPARQQVSDHPLEQAERYKYALMDKLKQEPILLNTDPSHLGKLSFPLGRCAVMTGMRRKEIEQSDLLGPDLSTVFTDESIRFTEDIEEWRDLSDREVTRQFWDLFDSRAKFRFPPLTEDQIQTIRAVLNPSTQIRRVPATPASWNLPAPMPADATIIKTLDLQQEKAAKQMGEGHRVLSGVAGSGKTLILTARARWLAENNPEFRILITCYNVTLAAYIRSVVKDSDSTGGNAGTIEALHFHGWARKIAGSLPRYGESLGDDEVDDAISEKVLGALEANPELRYDAVLVDEAHIMHPSWFRALKAALRDPEDGSLLIVNDASQKLRRRKRFSWASVGVRAKGRTRKLQKNYRNTKQVLTSAWQVLSRLAVAEPDSDETFPVVTPEESERSGPPPRLIIAQQPQAIASLALTACTQELKQGHPAKDIALLYRYGTGRSAHRISSLRQLAPSTLAGEKLYWVIENQVTKQSYGAQNPGIRLLTTQSALGLEFKSVYLLWAEDFDRALSDSDSERQLENLRELYVAMTRAQDQLTILCSASSALGRRLAGSADELGLEVVHA